MLRMRFAYQKISLVTGVLFLLSAAGCTSSNQSANSAFVSLLLIGLLLGAVIMFLIGRLTRSKTKEVISKENSHTVIESMKRVFKIVFAEGHFNELYTFEDTKKLFGFIPSTKRALVIIQAKVLVGYDFEKCVWELDEVNQKVKLVSFPQPEILSIEPDYKYYNTDENIFNLLSRDDLTRIQTNGKKQVEAAAIKSHLPQIAADQMHTLLTEVVQSKNWQIENSNMITGSNVNLLSAPK